MTDLQLAAPKPLLPEILMTLFFRLVALGCLWYGLRLWGELIGYSDGGTLRFDLLSADVKAAKATLAVIYPVAAIGLWLRGAWGPVIWTVAAGLEIAMHQFFPEIFGADRVIVAAITVTVAIYLLLRLAIVLMKPSRPARPHG